MFVDHGKRHDADTAPAMRVAASRSGFALDVGFQRAQAFLTSFLIAGSGQR